jgi:hypothetical protein
MTKKKNIKKYFYQIFNEVGQHRFSFGCYGNGDGEFDCLAGVAVNRIGQYIIADRYNHRIQIFDPLGHFLRSFGSQVPMSSNVSSSSLTMGDKKPGVFPWQA